MVTPVQDMQMKEAYWYRDISPLSSRFLLFMSKMEHCGLIMIGLALSLALSPEFSTLADFVLLFGLLYYRWVLKSPFKLPFKLPAYAGRKIRDPNNPVPGTGAPGKAEGILFIGNENPTGKEAWVTNSDARTHFLYIGTTGAGKTEGLKSLVTNSLTWGSGYVYVDGKADTDLWADLYSVARRFGRDDDVLILNYMTGNSDDGAVSNSMNPFSNGSASYLSNMIVSLMPDAGGDNAMWKERAVALMFALMPALTWKRDKQGLLLDVGVVRDHLELGPIIRLSRDPNMPERVVRGLQGYLNTLPGFVDEAFDDEGHERPPSPDQPMYDLQVARQQHGYLSMQYTRALQSLADEYGYIFKAQLADIDVLDVVLNRRILIALIPALEKSGDEAANLGKIIAACLKGMMGMTLGNTVEGTWEAAIGAKQAKSMASFMTVFDEVGYYTAPGMAVMAAQARSLGFSMVFAAQDIPAMEKRVKQEARSILGNCNIKMFGKIEDPLDTKKFYMDQVGDEYMAVASNFSVPTGSIGSLFSDTAFVDTKQTGKFELRPRTTFDKARKLREGEVFIFYYEFFSKLRLLHIKPPKVRALRVHKFLPVPGTTSSTGARERAMHDLTASLKDPDWKAEDASQPAKVTPELTALAVNYETAKSAGKTPVEAGAIAVASLAELAAGIGGDDAETPVARETAGDGTGAPPARPAPQEAKPEPESAPAAPQQTAPVQARQAAPEQEFREVPPLRAGDESAVPVGAGAVPGAAPPLRQGDEGVVPGGGHQETPGVGGPPRKMGGGAGDFSVVTKSGDVQISEKDLVLPSDVADVVRKSANALSRGLFGANKGAGGAAGTDDAE